MLSYSPDSDSCLDAAPRVGDRVTGLRPPTDEALRRPALQVTLFDRHLREDVARLFQLMDRLGTSALAAPQAGLDLAIAAVSCHGVRVAVVNPVLYDVVAGVNISWETCLSAPGRWLVARATGVVVTGRDERGRRRHLAVDGLPARCLQHAVDHVRGRLPVDRAITSSRPPSKSS